MESDVNNITPNYDVPEDENAEPLDAEIEHKASEKTVLKEDDAK